MRCRNLQRVIFPKSSYPRGYEDHDNKEGSEAKEERINDMDSNDENKREILRDVGNDDEEKYQLQQQRQQNFHTIGPNAFFKCDELKSIEIPPYVTIINQSTFEHCISLTDVIFLSPPSCSSSSSSSVCSGKCSTVGKTNDDINNNFGNHNDHRHQRHQQYRQRKNNYVKEISRYAFQYCTSLVQIDLSNTSIIRIGPKAFNHCSNLQTIYFPTTLQLLASESFMNCNNLYSVHFFPMHNKNHDDGTTNSLPIISEIECRTFANCNSLKSITLPRSIRKLGNGTFMNCRSLTNVTFSPPSLKQQQHQQRPTNKLLSISDQSKRTKKREGRYKKEGLQKIGKGAFEGCTSLKTIDFLPDTLQGIGQHAFSFCTSVTKIIFPSSPYMCSIGPGAFRECISLTNVTLPDSIRIIHHGAFEGCTVLKTINIPPSILWIGQYAFRNCPDLVCFDLPTSIMQDAIQRGEMELGDDNSVLAQWYLDVNQSVGRYMMRRKEWKSYPSSLWPYVLSRVSKYARNNGTNAAATAMTTTTTTNSITTSTATTTTTTITATKKITLSDQRGGLHPKHWVPPQYDYFLFGSDTRRAAIIFHALINGAATDL